MKYYVISDLHGFLKPFTDKLNEMGYDKANPNHTLVVLGDVFDRGDDVWRIYNYLTALSQDRLVLVKGNHEYLLMELLDKKYPEYHDFTNGTVHTVCRMAAQCDDCREEDDLYHEIMWGYQVDSCDDEFLQLWQKTCEAAKQTEIYKWLKSENWTDYFETKKCVMVHSFVPMIPKVPRGYDALLNAVYDGYTEWFEPDKNWRNAAPLAWSIACWGNPIVWMKAGMFTDTKILVCGHYATAYIREYLAARFDEKLDRDDNSIYEGYGLVAIDGMVAATGTANVYLVEENN